MVTTLEPAAVGGPTRRRHRHTMEGVDVALITFPGDAEMRALVQYALESALDVTASVPSQASRRAPLQLMCYLFNRSVGHNIPSGTIFERQMWVECIVTNERGDTVFATGLLDPNGDLRTRGSSYVAAGLLPPDTALVLFSGTAYRHGQPIDFFFDADAVVNRTIPPLERREARYTLPPQVLASSNQLRVRFRVLFRPLPPYVLRAFGLGHLVPRVPIFTMETLEYTVQLTP